MVSTTARREAVEWLRETRSTSLRRACRVVGLSTATWRYRPRLNPANQKLVEQLHAAAVPHLFEVARDQSLVLLQHGIPFVQGAQCRQAAAARH